MSIAGLPIFSDSVRISPSRMLCASVGVMRSAFTAEGNATISPTMNENMNTIMMAVGCRSNMNPDSWSGLNTSSSLTEPDTSAARIPVMTAPILPTTPVVTALLSTHVNACIPDEPLVLMVPTSLRCSSARSLEL